MILDYTYVVIVVIRRGIYFTNWFCLRSGCKKDIRIKSICAISEDFWKLSNAVFRSISLVINSYISSRMKRKLLQFSKLSKHFPTSFGNDSKMYRLAVMSFLINIFIFLLSAVRYPLSSASSFYRVRPLSTFRFSMRHHIANTSLL